MSKEKVGSQNDDENLDAKEDRRRLTERFSSIQRRTRTVGRVVWSATGGPLREIVTGTKTRATGFHQSVKTEIQQPYESKFEYDFIRLCEADYSVQFWISQPHRLEMFRDGKTIRYFPDFYVEKAFGRKEVVEVKRNKDREVRGETLEKLEMAENYYERLGWQFRILDARDLHVEPRFSNSKEIQLNARTPFSDGELFLLLDMVSIQKNRAMPLGKVVELLGGRPFGWKKLCGMLVKRKFIIDLDHHITDETLVHLPECDGAIP